MTRPAPSRPVTFADGHLDTLRASLRGRTANPDDLVFDQLRREVTFARERDLPRSVRSGGPGLPRHSAHQFRVENASCQGVDNEMHTIGGLKGQKREHWFAAMRSGPDSGLLGLTPSHAVQRYGCSSCRKETPDGR